MNIFDRDSEKRNIEKFFLNSNKEQTFAIFITGKPGTGKKSFINYIIENNNLNVFDFENHGNIYTCSPKSIKNEYEYILAILYKIQSEQPKNYSKFIQNYIDNINPVTFLDAGCSIIPNIRFFSITQDLLKNKYDNITQVQSNIGAKLATEQYMGLFSELILNYLSRIKPGQHIVFCLDNVQWLDESSIHTLKVLLEIATKRKSTYNVNISLIIASTTEDINSDSASARNNIQDIYLQIKDYFDTHCSLELKNFTTSLTKEFLKYSKREKLLDIADQIFSLTKGNPSELIFALSFPDDVVKEKCKIYKPIISNVFTTNKLSDIITSNLNCSYILSVLSILLYDIKRTVLCTLVTKISKDVDNTILNTVAFNNAIELLCSEGIIENINDYYRIKNSNIAMAMLEFIKENGDYVLYVNTIANVLFNDYCDYYHSLTLLKDVDNEKCIRYFIDLNAKTPEAINISILEIVAQAFYSNLNLVEPNILNDLVLTKILPLLFNAGKYNIANKLANFIYIHKCQIAPRNLTDYYIYYIKILVELSILKSDSSDEITATKLFKELEDISALEDSNIQLQIYLLGMSVYEHLLDFDEIQRLYNKADILVSQNKDITYEMLSVFYRNKGLYFSHRELTDDYISAIKYANHIKSPLYKDIMLGTSNNNLGLAHFYNGDANKAKKSFEKALKILDSVNCNTARIHNNIGICQFLLKEFDNAYTSFSTAIANKTDGIFIDFCTKANYALVLDVFGDTKQAVEILDTIIADYDTGNPSCQDTVAYSSAMLNRAYIHIKHNEYSAAISLIMKSTKQSYRFERELQQEKRRNLLHYCILKDNNLNLLNPSAKPEDINLDIADNKTDIFTKLYSLIPFAYYVI